jgi:predicted dienelactone hydrolase
MKRGKKILIVVLLLVVTALLVAFVPLGSSPQLSSEPYSDALLYSGRGSYLVGIRAAATGGETSLELRLWYPAAETERSSKATRYPYEIKMGDPFGTVTFASYKGFAVQDAPADLTQGSYPLVILSPGFSMGSAAYGWLAEHLVSYGFVVLGIEHPDQFGEDLAGLWQGTITRPQDVHVVLDYVDAQVQPGGDFAGLIDNETVAVVGHSLGGYTSLVAGGAQIDTQAFEAVCETAYQTEDPNAWLCDQILPHLAEMAALAGLDAVPETLWPDWSAARVDAIVPLAGDAYLFGESGLAGISVPVLAMGGTLDGDSPYLWGTHPTYEYASSQSKVRIGLTGAEHMIFSGPCERMPTLFRTISDEFCADQFFEREYAHSIVKHYVAAFLLAELAADGAAAGALSPTANALPEIVYDAAGY